MTEPKNSWRKLWLVIPADGVRAELPCQDETSRVILRRNELRPGTTPQELETAGRQAEKIKAGGIFYSTGFQLRRGVYKLKFLVRDGVTG